MSLIISGGSNGSLNNLSLSGNTATIVDTARAGGVIQVVHASTTTNTSTTSSTSFIILTAFILSRSSPACLLACCVHCIVCCAVVQSLFNNGMSYEFS